MTIPKSAPVFATDRMFTLLTTGIRNPSRFCILNGTRETYGGTGVLFTGAVFPSPAPEQRNPERILSGFNKIKS